MIIAVGLPDGSGLAQTKRTPAYREAAFTDFAVPLYKGARRSPSFTGAGRNYRLYQSAIREGFAKNQLFAGNFVLIGIGCGTGCMAVYVGDVATGRIFDFPLGGEENYMLQFESRPNSRLVKVTWNRVSEAKTECIKEDLVFSGAAFARHTVGRIPRLCSW